MSKVDNKLNRLFDIAEQLPGKEVTASTHLPPVDVNKEDKDADYELARQNFHLLIEKVTLLLKVYYNLQEKQRTHVLMK